MPRLRSVLIGAALVVLTLIGVALSFAYGAWSAPPEHVAVEGLAAPVRITWQPEGVVSIAAQDSTDRLAALGYVHGFGSTWPLLLWRQAALGELSRWYGARALPVDALARRLGLAARAREAYEGLSTATKRRLDAYTRGMNAALGSEALRTREELALLRLDPEVWQPWHTLAVERLVAWLASPIPAPEEAPAAATDSVRQFLKANDRLRQWLGLHGFEHSIAWAARDSAGTHVAARLVYGDAALPFFQEVVFTGGLSGNDTLCAASLPGTPFLPAGTSGGRSWALLPLGTAQLARAPFDTSAVLSYDRITTAAGAEHLVTTRRAGQTLYLETPAPVDTAALPPGLDSLATRAALDSLRASADSVWHVRWSGLAPVTDLSAWRAFAAGQPADFALLTGSGLHVDAGTDAAGTWAVTGTPRAIERLPDGGGSEGGPEGVLVGNTAWAEHVARSLRLRLEEDESITPEAWFGRERSTWAARLAPDMLAALDTLADSTGAALARPQDVLLGDALTYLRNWNFAYDRASIGASIFDAWARAYREPAGRLPTPLAADTANIPEGRRRLGALRDAVAALRARHGDDLRQWRWEEVAAHVYRVPGWIADTAASARYQRMARTRYAPIRLPGRGHPSAPSWGPSLTATGRPAPAAWEMWTRAAPGGSSTAPLHVRRRRFDLDAVLGRYRIPLRVPPPVALDAAGPTAPGSTTTLLPASKDSPSQ